MAPPFCCCPLADTQESTASARFYLPTTVIQSIYGNVAYVDTEGSKSVELIKEPINEVFTVADMVADKDVTIKLRMYRISHRCQCNCHREA
jgi:hypothetical protein